MLQNEGAQNTSKDLSKNRFWDQLGPPKRLQTPSKIKKNRCKIKLEKKGIKKNEKNTQEEPVLASEREARSSLRNVGTG